MSTEISPYLTDASGFSGWADKVLVPADEQQVVEILKNAVATSTPVTVVGAGYGLTGGRVAQGGWVISLEKFRRLEIHNGFARAGAAMSLLELRDAARPSGQFYAPDPTEINSSVGGTIATNASGSRSFRYGSTRRHLNAVRVALMDGRVVAYRRGDAIDFPVPPLPIPNVTKYTAGYPLRPGMDWIDLFCGSEGTLGVVLEAELSLLPIPDDLFTAIIFFASDDDAINAVEAWRPTPRLQMLEYVDRKALDMIRGRFPDIPRQAEAALLIESQGEADVDDWEQRLQAASALIDGSWFAVSAQDRERFRRFRHTLPEVVIDTVRRRGFKQIGTDYAVPLHRNRDILKVYHERLDAADIGLYMCFGHIGDAHVHINVLPETAQQAETASALLMDLAKEVVAMGGTVSAEHGLGKQKAHLLSLQYTPEHIEAMMAVKRRMDPQWLLGRGTLFPYPTTTTA
ncbi:MAG TPA: FAD-binding oxidoreductase [Bryobacteraceae bacterium]|nr:FAD-binding oxidoreductase [Bryobacteraceae bacterium]